MGGHDVEDSNAGLTALFVTASPLAHAQTAASAATPSAADWNNLTDMRIDVVKAALKLTPDQEKYWPAIEDAIRARVKNRQARFADIEKRVGELREGNPVEVLRNRDTVDFLQRRADALAQRQLSALPPIVRFTLEADADRWQRDVCFVPIGDIAALFDYLVDDSLKSARSRQDRTMLL